MEGAEAVVLAMGLSLDVEREAMDRVNITFPGMQAELISAVLDAVAPGTPVALLLLSGGCVDVSAFQADPRVGAIVWAGYPGQAGGEAIADALFGEFSPAGRTTQTWYPAEYIEQVSMFDMGFRPNASNGNPGRGHRFYTVCALGRAAVLLPRPSPALFVLCVSSFCLLSVFVLAMLTHAPASL